MLTVFKPVAEKRLQPVAGLLKNVSPNAISLLGLVFPVLFFLCVIQKLYALGLVVFIFNGVDLLDGMVARMSHKVTAFGGFLDSTIDRFADFTVLAAFGFAYIVHWDVLAPLILLTYLISYMRSRTELAAKGAIVASVGIIERAERLILIFLGLLFYAIFPHARLLHQNIMTWTCLLLIVLSAITVAQRFVFAYQKLRAYDK
jgi:archaetidylinositol phosphate synthase